MKRNVLVFGLCSGLIITTMMVFSTLSCYNNPNFESNMVLGYAGMLMSFVFVFVGIRNFREKYNDGIITFGKAFMLGFYISLIASTMYVVAWLFEYYLFIPDFMDKYSDHVIREMEKSGATATEIQEQMASNKKFGELYKSPVMVVLISYSEILPLGIVVALISALILKRKNKKQETAAVN